MTMTAEEQLALARLRARVDAGEYLGDRSAEPTRLTWAVRNGVPMTRAYTLWDAIARGEAEMRRDREETMGGWG